MKFLVDKCLDCGLDLTTTEPAEVTYFAETVSGTCPGCGRSYIMVDVTPEEATPPPPPEPEAEPEPTPRGGRRRAPEPEPEPVVEPESEPPAEPETPPAEE